MPNSPHVRHLVERLRATRDPFDLMANARALAQMGGNASEAVTDLLAIIGEGGPGQAAAAAYVLSEVGLEGLQDHPDRQDALIAHLDHADAEVRQWTGVTVAKLGPTVDRAQGVLIRRLHDPDEGVRIVIAHALGRVAPGDPDAWDALMKTMEDESPAVRSAAVRAIAGAKGKAAPYVCKLVDALSDSAEPVRTCAAETLGRLGGRAEAAAPPLLGCLSDSSAEVRLAVLRALEEITDETPDGGSVVISALEDRDERVRTQAISITQRWKLAGEAKTSLMWMLNDREQTVRFYALGALEQALAHQASPLHASEIAALTERLLDESSLVRERAAAVLSMLGYQREEAIMLLAAQLATGDTLLRLAAVRAVRHMAEDSVLAVEIRRRLNDPDEQVASEAALALATSGHWDGEVRGAVRESLISKNESCRNAGLEALQQPGANLAWADRVLVEAWSGLSPSQQRTAQSLRQQWAGNVMDAGSGSAE